jgi:MFS family permease
MAEEGQRETPRATFAVKAAILTATGLALLASPLVSAGMRDIARDFADQAMTDPVAVAIMSVIKYLPGEASTPFLIKFILLSVPALFIAVGSPLAGWFADRFGRRVLLISSTILFVIAGVSGALVSSLTAIFIGRAFLGLASAGMKTAAFSMTGDFFQGKERERFVGWQGSAMKIGGFVFLYFGGLLAAIHWKVGFWGYALALVFLPLMFMVPESRPPRDSRHAADGAKPSVPVIATLDVMLAAFMASALFFMTIVQAPFFLPAKFGVGAAGVGFVTGTANLAAAVSAVTFVRFKSRLTYPGIFSAIFVMMAFGYFLVTLAPTFLTVVIAFVIAGCGFGLIVPAQSGWMLAAVPPQRRGLGIGLVTTAMYMGQFFSPILMQPFIDRANPTAVFSSAYQVLIVLAVIYGVREFMSRPRRGALATGAAGFIGLPARYAFPPAESGKPEANKGAANS